MSLVNWLAAETQKSSRRNSPRRRARSVKNDRRWAKRRALIELLESRQLLAVDFGDAPDLGAGVGLGNYETLLANNGPTHTTDVTATTLFLGARVDAEVDAITNALADGDDRFTSPGSDDEDGLIDPANDLALTAGETPRVRVRVTNNTGTLASLFGWIDVNRDGVFDNATERTSVNIPSGTTNGVATLIFPTLSNSVTPGASYARFRLSTDINVSSPNGPVINGEVEDYRVSISSISESAVNPTKSVRIANGLNGSPALIDASAMGRSLAQIGDIDGDGVTDLATGFSTQGRVNIALMNANGTIKSNTLIGDGLNGGPALGPDETFGISVAGLPDMDGDGIGELAVGGYIAYNSGTVHILFLNATGGVKSSIRLSSSTNGLPAINAADFFGQSVTAIGDFDGDGIGDIAVGAPGDGTGGAGTGAIYVLLLNANGTVKANTRIASQLNGGPTIPGGSAFGSSVTAIGDIDNDGVTDLAVGASASGGQGSVFVLLMNPNRTVKSSVRIGNNLGGGPALGAGAAFGSAVTSLGDLDGDGTTDILIGAENDATAGLQRGAVHVAYLNSNGSAKRTVRITQGVNGGPTLANTSFFGSGVAPLGDLDQDGFIDFAVGARGDDTGGSDRGAIHVLYTLADTTRPAVNSIVRSVPSTAATNADSLTFRVTFSEDVIGIDANDFTISGTTASIQSVIGDGNQTSFLITVSGGDLSALNGIVGLNLAVAATAFDRSGNSLTIAEPTIDETYLLDNINPTLLSIERRQPLLNPTSSDALKFRLRFSESVQSLDTADLIVVGTTGTATILPVTGSTYDVIIAGGDLANLSGTVGLDVAPSASITDLVGNSFIVVEPPIDETFIVVGASNLDFGDAPDSGLGTAAGNYRSTLVDDGPRHTISSEIFIGNRNDGEPDSQQSPRANGDDLFVASTDFDDEDGVVESGRELFIATGTAPKIRMRVTNTSANPATLYGWIDVNRDGVFDDVTERATIPVAAGTTNSLVTLSFPTIPVVTVSGTTYARFRLSTDTAASTSTGLASDGEVEDYRVHLNRPSVVQVDASRTDKVANLLNGGPQLTDLDNFGTSLAAIGDIDGDGIVDMASGAIGDDTGVINSNRGAVHILFMNANGTVRESRKIANAFNGGPTLANQDGFGSAITSLGDLDGDGVSEIVVGSPGDDTGGANRGSIYVLFLNDDGTAKSRVEIGHNLNGGPALTDAAAFGSSLTNVGDMNGDSIPDLVVGATGSNTGRGTVYTVFMNRNGSASSSVQTLDATLAPLNGAAGSSVASLGDLDNDGVTDIAVGNRGFDTLGTDIGAVMIVLMNANGTPKTPIVTISSNTNGGPALGAGNLFGSSMTELGDIDGDGIQDIAVGAIGDGTGGAGRGAIYMLMMNANGTVKRSVKVAHNLNSGPALVDFDNFGNAIANAGDLDGDGIIELLVGAPGDNAGGTDRGAFYALSIREFAVSTGFTGSIPENSAIGTVVGNFAILPAIDPPFTYTFSLVSGVGSTNNTSFNLSSAGELTSNVSFDFEATPTQSIRVRTTRSDGLFYENPFTIQVTNVNEQPTANPGGPYSANEGTVISLTGSAIDPDANSILVYEWDFDYDGVNFQVDSTLPNPMVTVQDGPSVRTVAVRVVDNGTPMLTSTVATTTITSINVPPTVSSDLPFVNGAIGSEFVNTGLWNDIPADVVTLEASLGLVTKNPNGTWNWTFTPTMVFTNQTVTITASDDDGGSSQTSFTINASLIGTAVIGRHVFYNNSGAFFGGGAGNPTASLDTSKIALLPGQTTSTTTYTNYSRGLNGLVIDISNITGTPTASDFAFATWNGINVAGFEPLAATPNVELFTGGGTNGADRVKITFADNAIRNSWLRITVLSTANTGIASNDVFYFGHAVGDMYGGNIGDPISVRVNPTDVSNVRQNQSPDPGSVGITRVHDLNKDGRVNPTDISIVRQNQSSQVIRYFTAPTSLAFAFDDSSIPDASVPNIPTANAGNSFASSTPTRDSNPVSRTSRSSISIFNQPTSMSSGSLRTTAMETAKPTTNKPTSASAVDSVLSEWSTRWFE